MNGLEEVEWSEVVSFLRRYSGLIVALVFLIWSRRKKKASKRPESQQKLEPRRGRGDLMPIEPGDDASKLSEKFSRRE